MNNKKTGEIILALRKEKNLTQKQIADRMNISDKTISKWERGLGYPDIGLLPELCRILETNIETLLSGEFEMNNTFAGNMLKLIFYVCPTCGNLITAAVESEISCCSKMLAPLNARASEGEHSLSVEIQEDEFLISTDHPMQKEHYISFVAYGTSDKSLVVKKYPEWNLDFRLNRMGHGRLYFYCSEHGLYYQKV